MNPFEKVAEIRHPKACVGILALSPTRARMGENRGRGSDAFEAFATGADP